MQRAYFTILSTVLFVIVVVHHPSLSDYRKNAPSNKQWQSSHSYTYPHRSLFRMKTPPPHSPEQLHFLAVYFLLGNRPRFAFTAPPKRLRGCYCARSSVIYETMHPVVPPPTPLVRAAMRRPYLDAAASASSSGGSLHCDLPLNEHSQRIQSNSNNISLLVLTQWRDCGIAFVVMVVTIPLLLWAIWREKIVW